MEKKSKNEFWVINISNRNVSLSDLALTIHAGRTYNLLDSKHFKYTLEQLEKSAKEGSIYKKRDKILLCNGQPEFPKLPPKEISKQPMIVKPKTSVEVTMPKYDELIYSDEDYADEISDLFNEGEGK